MKLDTVGTLFKTIVRTPQVFTGEVHFLFILSHMRSYSTLLSHILGSHPEIQGYKERHRDYDNWLDLQRFRYHSFQEFQELPGKYLMDKVLHFEHRIADSIFRDPQNRFLILLRKPEQTILSIINMGLHHDHKKKHQDPEFVLNYYRQRLQELITHARFLEGRAGLLHGEALISSTEATLASLTDWLQLGSPLKPSYQTFRDTGKEGAGDPSSTIKTGEIVQGSTSNLEQIDVPSNILAEAQRSYDSACAELTPICQEI